MSDFNARGQSWGYQKDTKKGTQVGDAAEITSCTLLTDANHPTRLGNSVSPDTCPDLTYVRGVRQATWENLLENLGSDHYNIRTQVSAENIKRKIGTAKITDWNAFRKECKHMEGAITSIEEWYKQLKEIQQQYTQKVERSEQTPEVDSRLLRLWEAGRGLTKRWKKQRLNKKLKKKIAEVTKEAEEYAAQLTRQSWQKFSDSLNRTLSTAKTWRILKALMDPTKTKSESNKAIQRLVHQFEGTEEELLEKVRAKCYGQDKPEAYTERYRGEENSDLDRPITREEVFAAVKASTRNTAAGADKIRNALLRNLSDEAVTQLTNFLNAHWEAGTLLEEWKHAEVVMIPKPGKKLLVENLRPTSLTSCLGKLYERIVTRRLQQYMEDEDLYPHSMFGFRTKLSTQDVLLQIKEGVISNIPYNGENIIMALDVKGAFDNVSHAAILKGLDDLNSGRRIHGYVTAFLSNRTATVGLGDLRTDKFHTPNKGTPQGSVISPILFNIAMIGIARKL
ncbi:uncharacterized protein [Dermacentor andersoni]|uniref:uncharacterized protein n=1 Tax=Dermacentor andersoni TaxID=34620 RepID=UPI003B3B6D53